MNQYKPTPCRFLETLLLSVILAALPVKKEEGVTLRHPFLPCTVTSFAYSSLIEHKESAFDRMYLSPHPQNLTHICGTRQPTMTLSFISREALAFGTERQRERDWANA